MSENPYAAPLVDAFVAPPVGAEAMRQQYLSHEASVKSIGTLYMLGAIFFIPIGLGLVAMTISGAIEADEQLPAALMIWSAACILGSAFYRR